MSNDGGVAAVRGGMRMVRVAVMATTMLLGSCAVALAGAGSPDPSFGRSGVVELRSQSGKTFEVSRGAAMVLPDGGVLVPSFRTDHIVRRGEAVGVRARSIRFTWLDASGATVRSSTPVPYPKDMSDIRLRRAPDGSLLLIGLRATAKDVPYAIYVLRLSADGLPQAAPGRASASVEVPFTAIAGLSVTARTRTSLGGMVIAPSGRVFAVLSQYTVDARYGQVVADGGRVIGVVDPSVGLATSFAGGALRAAAATDSRTSVSIAMHADAADRLLLLTRTSKQAIAGSEQDVRLQRFDAAGVLDTTFAGGSIDIDGTSIDTSYTAPSVTTLGNGDVLVRHDIATEQGERLLNAVELRRYLPSGEPVTSFGSAGRATIALASSRGRYGSSFTSGSPGYFDESSTTGPLEQPDGKLIVTAPSGYPLVNGFRGGAAVMRITAGGALDTSYEQRGYARLDAPTTGYVSSSISGLDAAGRVVGTVSSYVDAQGRRSWVTRLLAGDAPTPAASARLNVDARTSCGASLARACFDADGAVQVTGRALVGARPLAGATVVVAVSSPPNAEVSVDAPSLLPVRTGRDGRFRVAVGRNFLPGAWVATARVLATPNSQRVDSVRPVHFTLGPRSDIRMLKVIQRAQALAISLDYIVSDTIVYDKRGNATKQCASVAACFRPSKQILELVSKTRHPALGKAGLILGKPDYYQLVTRVDTAEFNLELVITQTAFDTTYSCRGDAAARKRWCPDGTFNDYFNDTFVTAGIDGSPFDY